MLAEHKDLKRINTLLAICQLHFQRYLSFLFVDQISHFTLLFRQQQWLEDTVRGGVAIDVEHLARSVALIVPISSWPF